MDTNELKNLLAAANTPKDRLLRIRDELCEIGAQRKADALDKIIWRLEVWQNTK